MCPARASSTARRRPHLLLNPFWIRQTRSPGHPLWWLDNASSLRKDSTQTPANNGNYLALQSTRIFLHNFLNHFFTQNSKYLPHFRKYTLRLLWLQVDLDFSLLMSLVLIFWCLWLLFLVVTASLILNSLTQTGASVPESHSVLLRLILDCLSGPT